MANIERDGERTGNLSDVELAIKFYEDFNDDSEFFGKVILNETFNEWIESLNFSYINHGWDTPEGKVAWSGYRSTVRGYMKNGVMQSDYGAMVETGRYAPFIVNVNKFGIDLKVVKYSDHIVDAAMGLAVKRQNTIKGQTSVLKKGFRAMRDIYGVNDLKIDLQEKLVEAQNDMRLSIEKSFDEITRKTVKDTTDLIEASRKAMKGITDTAYMIEGETREAFKSL